MNSHDVAKAGALDPAFASGGRLVLPSGFTGAIQSMIVDGDGQWVVAGVQLLPGKTSRYIVARFSPTGVQDLSWGDDGVALGNFAPTGAGADSLTLFAQSDGLLIAGKDQVENAVVFGITRLNHQGQADKDFGNNGSLYYRLQDVVGGATPSWLDFRVMSAMTTEGKILLAAELNYPNGDFHPIVVRFNADGSLDRTWDARGFKVVVLEAQTGFRSSRLHGIHADAGKVIVSANFGGSASSTGNKNYMARFNENGALDLTFAVDGVLTYSAGERDIWPLLRIVSSNLSAQAPHYLGTGALFHPSPRKWAGLIVGLDRNGAFDTRFNGGDPVLADPDPLGAYIDQCIAQPGNQRYFIATGSREEGTLLCRYSAQGVLDQGFGENGYVIKPFTGALRVGIYHSHPVIVDGSRLLINHLDDQDRAVVDAYTL